MSAEFSVIALLAAYNEADVIGPVVGDLIAQGIQVYLLDDGSTDGTADQIAPLVGRGVLAIERLADRQGADAAAFDWERILRRKAELAVQLDADWFIHHDADEFRESPWPGGSLRDGIRIADALGFNAIDFRCLNFWPTHDGFRPGDDVRDAFPFYEEASGYDRVRINAWKKTQPIDLVTSGGHEVKFASRSLFPVQFLLRHYPIRGQCHGERKVFRERRPRFLDAERARGWHVQYDHVSPGARFIRGPETLTEYDERSVKRELLPDEAGLVGLRDQLAEASAEMAHLRAALDAEAQTARDLRKAVADEAGKASALRVALTEKNRQITELEGSLSWRLTRPARAILRALRGH